VRNSVDHGIEMPDGSARENGKSETGKLSLSAAHKAATS